MYTGGTKYFDEQTAITIKHVHNAFELSVLAEALAIFRGHVLKLVLQALVDCTSQNEGENPSKQQRFAASAGYM